MRVAVHGGPLLQPVPGGIGRYVQSLLRALPDTGVDAYAFGAGARPPGIPAGTEWVDLGAPHGSLRYECWHRLRRPRLDLDADVVHATSLAVPPVRDSALVVTVHDVAFLRVPQVTTPRGVRFHRRGLELTRRDADLVISVSAFTRDELVREGFDPETIVVAHHGIDPPADRSDDDIDATVASAGVSAPYVLTVSTVEPRKDLPTMVDAVARVRAQGAPDLELVIVGGTGWGRVEGIDRPFVRRLGDTPWPTVDALIRRARAFCVSSRYEGFGLPALEAIARGAPLAAASGSSVEEVVAGAALLFPPGDVDACAAALQRLLDDERLRADLAARGRARAAEFTWPRCAEAHAGAYARAVTRRAARG
jgi:glycosyltransferase involved in cell wall biosynthesis